MFCFFKDAKLGECLPSWGLFGFRPWCWRTIALLVLHYFHPNAILSFICLGKQPFQMLCCWLCDTSHRIHIDYLSIICSLTSSYSHVYFGGPECCSVRTNTQVQLSHTFWSVPPYKYWMENLGGLVYFFPGESTSHFHAKYSTSQIMEASRPKSKGFLCVMPWNRNIYFAV